LYPDGNKVAELLHSRIPIHRLPPDWLNYVFTPKRVELDSIIGGHIASGDVLYLHYYRYANDDKYFFSNSSNMLYQDSGAYSSEYHNLPAINNDYLDISPASLGLAGADVILIMSRQQYGHFLYDDLVPLLSFLLIHHHCYKYILFLHSLPWQLRAVSQLLSMSGLQIELVPFQLPPKSCRLRIHKASFMLPSYPYSLLPAFKILKEKIYMRDRGGFATPCQKAPMVTYLSREGFEASLPRVANRGDVLKALSGICQVKYIRTHDYDETSLSRILSSSRLIVCEPGTLPLIAGLFSNTSSRIIALSSSRCLTDCPNKYIYSGWRYHIPFLRQAQYVFCRSVDASENPFSDRVIIPIDFLLDRIAFFFAEIYEQD
jgi:hypothetical protein